MKKIGTLLSVIAITSGAQTSHAAMTLVAHYGLGESGTVAGSAPFTPLVDDIGAHNIENSAALSATIGSSGIAAPGSSAYLTKTQSGGWYDTDAGANSLNLTNNWAAQIWIRPGTNGGTLAFQTDSQGSSTTGETIWLANDNGGSFAFGTGADGVSGKTLTTTSYSIGTWYQVGIVNYNGTMNYFVNGIQLTETTARSSKLGDMQIGWAAGNNPTSGAFDELNVWTFDHNVDSLASVSAAMNAIPEPSTALLLSGFGLIGLMARRRHS